MRRPASTDEAVRLEDAGSALAALDPHMHAAYRKFAARADALGPKVREFILLAVNASCTVRDAAAVRRHIREAIRHGASGEELLEVVELASALGIHTLDLALPMLGANAASSASSPARETTEALRSRLTGSDRETLWSPFWEELLRVDPRLFEATMEFLEAPWQHGPLSAKMKEFIYIAIDAACTHLYGKGLAAHIQRARRFGATTEELMAVLSAVATVGLSSTLELALPILTEEVGARTSADAGGGKLER